jgi:hypothetical protein
MRDAMAKYGRDDKSLRQTWQQVGPVTDWVEYLDDAPWQRIVKQWNAKGGPQIDAGGYRVGAEPEFEAFVKSAYPDKRQAYPGRRSALEWLIENEPEPWLSVPIQR